MWTVVGHNKNKKYFETIIKNGQLSHAYLFSGSEMIGKKMFAQDLVNLLNNRKAENNPDLKLVSYTIEDARNLKSFLSVKPYYGPYKVAIIDDAENLTAEASNALLKILEEPSASSIIILISSRPKSLLPTVLSRCQEIKFQSLDNEELESFIPAKLKVEDKKLLKQIAHGRPGWILKNIDKIDGIRNSIQEFNNILDQGIFEKFQYVVRVHDKENYSELISNLIYWHYSQSEKSPKILKGLMYLSNIVSQSQFNHRLALENFLISI